MDIYKYSLDHKLVLQLKWHNRLPKKLIKKDGKHKLLI